MDDLDLLCRLFETSFEPTGKKMVNNYFNLRWIEVLKNALEDDDLALLTASQFGKVLQMGDHTFSVMFLRYILSRQLVTEKDFELWWLFVGKPIRYAIQDFAIVTGLNYAHTCSRQLRTTIPIICDCYCGSQTLHVVHFITTNRQTVTVKGITGWNQAKKPDNELRQNHC